MLEEKKIETYRKSSCDHKAMINTGFNSERARRPMDDSDGVTLLYVKRVVRGKQ